eukprot:GHVT01081757.1.p1 GENE.GHVT01081757.1~~GHVT01081757.1.p1  ORF type:complete len:229 (+),score=44.65 GHVT01081757.1:356-1042(+)
MPWKRKKKRKRWTREEDGEVEGGKNQMRFFLHQQRRIIFFVILFWRKTGRNKNHSQYPSLLLLLFSFFASCNSYSYYYAFPTAGLLPVPPSASSVLHFALSALPASQSRLPFHQCGAVAAALNDFSGSTRASFPSCLVATRVSTVASACVLPAFGRPDRWSAFQLLCGSSFLPVHLTFALELFRCCSFACGAPESAAFSGAAPASSPTASWRSCSPAASAGGHCHQSL